jgi:hypothetical protein
MGPKWIANAQVFGIWAERTVARKEERKAEAIKPTFPRIYDTSASTHRPPANRPMSPARSPSIREPWKKRGATEAEAMV